MTRRRRSVSFSSNHRDPNNGSNSSRSFSRRHLSTSIASNSSSARTSGKPRTNLFNLFLGWGWGIFKNSSFRLILDTRNPILGRVGTCSIHYVSLHSRKYIYQRNVLTPSFCLYDYTNYLKFVCFHDFFPSQVMYQRNVLIQV